MVLFAFITLFYMVLCAHVIFDDIGRFWLCVYYTVIVLWFQDHL